MIIRNKTGAFKSFSFLNMPVNSNSVPGINDISGTITGFGIGGGGGTNVTLGAATALTVADGQVFISNTFNYNGVFDILSVAGNGLSFEIDTPFVVDEPSGNFQNVFNTLSNNEPGAVYSDIQIRRGLIDDDISIIGNKSELNQEQSINYFLSFGQSEPTITAPVILSKGSIITAPPLFTNVNDYDPPGFRDASGKIIATQINVSAIGNRQIRGLAAPSVPVYVEVTIYNEGVFGISGSNISVRNDNPNPLPQNRFKMSGNQNLVFRRRIVFIYDVNSLRWMLRND